MKRRRTFAAIVLALVLICALMPVLSACNTSGGGIGGGGADTLVIYNWEDYIDTGLLNEFEKYYREVTGRSLSITYSTFDTNETMLTQVMRGETAVDLVCPSEYAIERLMRAGLLANQTELVEEFSADYPEAFSNLANVNQTVLDKIGETFGSMDINGESYDMRDYMVPYMWGTLGLLYNTKIISEEELEKYGWGMLWNESGNPDLENMILMKDSVRDSYAAVVFYMEEYGLLPDGISATYGKPFSELTANELINCTDPEMLDAAERLLTEQRERISGYEVDFGKDDMINEIVYLDLAWSGDALWAIEESEYYEDTDTYQLGYYVPEKSNIWYDGWAVLESSDSKLAAMMFIDYMCRPDSGARNIGYIGYTSAVDQEVMKYDYGAAQALLDVEYLWYANEEECSVYDYNGKPRPLRQRGGRDRRKPPPYGTRTRNGRGWLLSPPRRAEGQLSSGRRLHRVSGLHKTFLRRRRTLSGDHRKPRRHAGLRRGERGRRQHVAARESGRRSAFVTVVVSACYSSLRRSGARSLFPERSSERQTAQAERRGQEVTFVRTENRRSAAMRKRERTRAPVSDYNPLYCI